MPGHGRPGEINDPVPDRDYGDRDTELDGHRRTRRGPDAEDPDADRFEVARAAAADLRRSFPEASADAFGTTGSVYVSIVSKVTNGSYGRALLWTLPDD